MGKTHVLFFNQIQAYTYPMNSPQLTNYIKGCEDRDMHEDECLEKYTKLM